VFQQFINVAHCNKSNCRFFVVVDTYDDPRKFLAYLDVSLLFIVVNTLSCFTIMCFRHAV